MAIIHKETNNETGIITKLHDVGGKHKIVEKTYDAQPILDYAAEQRAITDGEKWGDMRKIGVIPMAEYAKMISGDRQAAKEQLNAFLKKNPKFVTFNKFLKTGAKG